MHERFAGPHVAKEAARQDLDVVVTGSRNNPQEMVKVVRRMIQHRKPPHFVFCFAIRPGLRNYYRWLKKHNIKILAWYPDQCERNRDRMWRGMKDYFDAIVFSILHTAQQYRTLAPTVLWVPQYFDHISCSINGKLPKRLRADEPIYDLAFIGGCDKRRETFLRRLAEKYTHNFITHPFGQLKEVRRWDMAKVYAQAKIAINIQRGMFLQPGPFITSNRAYNVMGSGAMLINHYVKRMELLWEEGVHCVSYDDTYDDLERKVAYYLEHDEEREKIAAAGQADVLEYHTLERRISQYWRLMLAIHNGDTAHLREWSFEQKGKHIQRNW
jgi:hypothetical protein